MVKLHEVKPMAGHSMAVLLISAPSSLILNQSPLPSYSVTSDGALDMYTVMGPWWKMAWSRAKPTVDPAVTVATSVVLPDARPPTLQRRSVEVRSVTGELLLVFWRTYS